MRETSKQVTNVFCLVEWRDVVQLCNFQEVVAGTRYPTQGRDNVRLSQTNSMGVICPPVLVIHRCTTTIRTCTTCTTHARADCLHLGLCRSKHFAPRGDGREPSFRARVERVQIKSSIGIVHEYCTHVQLAYNYPEVVPEDPFMAHWHASQHHHKPKQPSTQKIQHVKPPPHITS